MRAAGTACGRNPLPVVVPCHRVLRSGGALGGYGGGLPMKEALLQLEGVLDDAEPKSARLKEIASAVRSKGHATQAYRSRPAGRGRPPSGSPGGAPSSPRRLVAILGLAAAAQAATRAPAGLRTVAVLAAAGRRGIRRRSAKPAKTKRLRSRRMRSGEEDEECEEEGDPEAPPECLLSSAEATVFASANRDKVRLQVRYTDLLPDRRHGRLRPARRQGLALPRRREEALQHARASFA